jgi:hypothetical protein
MIIKTTYTVFSMYASVDIALEQVYSQGARIVHQIVDAAKKAKLELEE